MVTLRCSCEPRFMKMLEVCIGTNLPLMRNRGQGQAQVAGFLKLVCRLRVQNLSRQDRTSRRQGLPPNHDGLVEHGFERDLRHESWRWTKTTAHGWSSGVPAGMAVGVKEPVGEIPPLSDVASKGKCWSAAVFSSIPGRLSRREQPARISPIKRTENPAAFRQFPLRQLHEPILPRADHHPTSRKLDAIVPNRFISELRSARKVEM